MIKIIGENKDKDCKFSFAGKYDQLETLNGLKPYYNYYCIVAESADETNFKNLFQACQASIIYFHNFGTSKVTNMKGMFDGCYSLTFLDLSGFDTSKTEYMYDMFYSCHSLASLDLSNWNISNAKDMDSIFRGCGHLHLLDISSFDFSKIASTFEMFSYCGNLTDLKFGKNLRTSLNLYDCPLTHKSAMSVINGLGKPFADYTFTRKELIGMKHQNPRYKSTRYRSINNIINFSEETYNTLSKNDIILAENINW